MSGYTAEQWTAAGFDAAYYKEQFPKVVEVYGATDAGVLAHYIIHGNSEGRPINAAMEAWLNAGGYNAYVATNPHLRGLTKAEAYVEYAQEQAAKNAREANASAIASGVVAGNALALRVTALEAGGAKGEPGTDGDDGDKGEKGQKGKDGSNGTNGSNGSNGTDGDDGDKGQKGQKGTQASDGQDGDKGDKGQKGEKGQGQKGEPSQVKGDKGQKGEKGQGQKGEPSTVKGQKGEPSTEKGNKGQKGLKGENGVSDQLTMFLNDLVDGTALDYTGLDLSNVDFEADGFTLPGAATTGGHVLRNCKFDGNNSAKALLTVAYTVNMDLTGSTFVGCDLGLDSPAAAPAVDNNVILKNCSFQNAILSGFSLVNVTAANAPSDFRGAQLQKTYLPNTETQVRAAAVLPSVALDHADFTGANLAEVTLNANTTVTYANFTNAILAEKVNETNGRRQFDMSALDATEVEGAIFRDTSRDANGSFNRRWNEPIGPDAGTGAANADKADYALRYGDDSVKDLAGNNIGAFLGPRLSAANIDLSNRSLNAKIADEVFNATHTSSGKLVGTLTQSTAAVLGDITFRATTTGGDGTGAVLTITYTASTGLVTGAIQTAGSGYGNAQTVTLVVAAAKHPFTGIGDISFTAVSAAGGALASITATPSAGLTGAQTITLNSVAFNSKTGGYDIVINKTAATISGDNTTHDTAIGTTIAAGEFTAAKLNAAINGLNAGTSNSSVTLTTAPVIAALTQANFGQNAAIRIPELENNQYVDLGGAKFTAKDRIDGTKLATLYSEMVLTQTVVSNINHIVPTMGTTTLTAAEVKNSDIARAAGKTDKELKELANAAAVVYKAGTWAAWKWRRMHTLVPTADSANMCDASETDLTLTAATGKAVEAGEYMLLDSELVKIVSVNAAGTSAVMERGQGGTTAAAHDGSSTAIVVLIYKLPENRHETVPHDSGKDTEGNIRWEKDYGDLYLPPFVADSLYRGVTATAVATTTASTNVLTISDVNTATTLALGKARSQAAISQKTYANEGLIAKSYTGTLTLPVGMTAITVFDKETDFSTNMLVGPNMDLTHLGNFNKTAPTNHATPTVAQKTHDFGSAIFALDGANLSNLFVDLDGIKSLNNTNLSGAYVETSLGANFAAGLNIHGARFRSQLSSGLANRVNWWAKGIKGEVIKDSPYGAAVNYLYQTFTSSGQSTSCVYGPGIDLAGCTMPSNVNPISSSLEDSSWIGMTGDITQALTISGSLKNAVVSSNADPRKFTGGLTLTGIINGADFTGMVANVDPNDSSKKLNMSGATAISAVPRPIFKDAQMKGSQLFSCTLSGVLAVATNAGVNADAVRIDFRGANLEGAELNQASFLGVDFSTGTAAANLKNLHIKQACDLTNSSFKGADCTNMKAQTVAVDQTATTAEQVIADLEAADFSGATINGMQIKKSAAANLLAANFKGAVLTDSISAITDNFHTDFKVRVDKVGTKHIFPNADTAHLDLSDQELSIDIDSTMALGISNLKNFVLKDCNITANITMDHSGTAAEAKRLEGFNMKNVLINPSVTVGLVQDDRTDAQLVTLFGTADKAAGSDSRSTQQIKAYKQLPAMETNQFFKFMGQANNAVVQSKSNVANGFMYDGNYGVPTMALNGKEIRGLKFNHTDLTTLNFRGAKYSSAHASVLSSTQSASANTDLTIVHAAITPALTVGEYVELIGHSTAAINQVYRVKTVTDSTNAVLFTDAADIGTGGADNDNTTILRRVPVNRCLLPTNYKLFTAADYSQYVMGPEVVINYNADFDGANLNSYTLGDAQGGMKFGLGTFVVDFNTNGTNLPTFVGADLTNVDFGKSKLADSATAGTSDLVNLHRAILNGTDFGEVEMEQGQLVGLKLTANSNTIMPATSSTVNDHNMSIIGTVDGQKKLLTNKVL